MTNEAQNKEKIREFVRQQLAFADKQVELNDDTPLLTSKLLDSLALVDLILFVEDNFPGVQIGVENTNKVEIDTINKLWILVSKKQ